MTLLQKFKKWAINRLSDDVESVDTHPTPIHDTLDAEPYPEHMTPPPADETEPWVNISSTTYDPVKGFRIELDWNDAFIQHLRDGGVKGRNDEEVVQKWLGFLYGDLIERLESTVVDKVDKNRVNDFI